MNRAQGLYLPIKKFQVRADDLNALNLLNRLDEL